MEVPPAALRGVEQWTINMLCFCCCIPSHLPPKTCEPREYPPYGLGSQSARALQGEVDKVLENGVVKIARMLAFYSRLFLVRAFGGWRLVIDLLPVNIFMIYSKFRMETGVSVLASSHEVNIRFLIDLHLHFQIPIHPELRPYL